MTTSFAVTRDDLIKASLRTLGVIGQGDVPTASEVTDIAQALNIMIKSWMVDGLPLWGVTELLVPMVVGKQSYTLGPTGDVVTSYRPLRLVDAFIRTSDNHDTNLQIISRQEYNLQGDKGNGSIPNQVYYDPQLSNGVLYVFPPATDTTRTIHLIIHRPLNDINLSSDGFDFPQEWYQALKWGLAAEIATEFGVPTDILQVVETKAVAYKEKMVDWSQEEASTFFKLDTRGLR